MKEEDLYQPVKNFFEEKGYTVHSEVNFCDVTAIKDEELIIIELKKNLSVDLLIQGVTRQKISNNVYIAIPKYKKMKKYDELKNVIYLLRRLEIGLILVDVEKSIVEVVQDPKPFDLEKSRSRNKKKTASLIKEFMQRSVDLNKGGSTGKKLVTAYREQAILVACILKMFGEQSPSEIRAKGGDKKKTQGILKNNFYNWFESPATGRYKLTKNGADELKNYTQLTEIFFKKISEENKILYISDLDGTLLNSGAALSQNSAELLNGAISQGVCFTVATARTKETAVKVLKNVDIQVPAVLMNGVMVYDFASEKYLLINGFSNNKAVEIVKVLSSFDKNFFMYEIDEEKPESGLTCYYKDTVRSSEIKFLADRVEDKERKFVKTENYKKCLKNMVGTVVHFAVIGEPEILSEMLGMLSDVKGISCEYYKDTYSDDWFLEISSAKAGKKSSVRFVADYIGAKYVVAFGDNLNDLEFMEDADEAYAVSNAKEAVLKSATGVILSNNEDGVAKYISKRQMEFWGNK